MDPSAISGHRARSTHKVRTFAAVLGVAALTVSGLVAATGPATAVFSGRGDVDVDTGFPDFYTDGDGLSLQLCIDDTANCPTTRAELLDAADGAGEGFYSAVSAEAGGISMGLDLEAAFFDVGPSQEVVFARTQYSAVSGLEPGQDYTMTDPYGSRTCTADGAGTIPNNANTGCRLDEGGLGALDFDGALAGRVGPFLTWDTLGSLTAGPPAGYIGDGATPHTITGSPDDFNTFRVQGPGIVPDVALGEVSCPGIIADCAQTDLFVVSGQLADAAMASTDVRSLAFANTPDPVTLPITYRSFGTPNAGVVSVVSDNPAFVVLPEGGPGCASVSSPGSCSINVTYQPVPDQSSSGTVTITDNTLGGIPKTVSVSGSSVAVAATPGAPVTFASTKVGSSRNRLVTVTNTGVRPLNVSGVTSTAAAFAAGLGTCSSPVLPTGTCNLSVTFNPSSIGNKSATMTVNSNGRAPAPTITVGGVGIRSVLGAPNGIAFGDTAMGGAKVKRVTITNTGSAGMVLGTPTITGPSRGDYRMIGVSANPCFATNVVTAGGSCQIAVTFSPKALGSRAATLTVFGDGRSRTVALRGTGVDRTRPAILVKSPAAGATGVAVRASVVVSFSEAVKGVNRSTFMLTNQSNGLATSAVISGRAGNRWLLNPRANLSPGTRYVVRLVGGTVAIRDMSDNGVRSNTWSFRTR